MDEFEKLLERERTAAERFVRFRINSVSDADDVLQEVFITAYQKFHQLKNKDSFKAWLISIAKNKCNDYFRKTAEQYEIPIDLLIEKVSSHAKYGISVIDSVRETLDLLGNKDKQILYLYFWEEKPQAEIAELLSIPLGTVKSRLHTAKQNFKSKYPYNTDRLKGETSMKKFPEIIPNYKITELSTPAFPVVFEELPNWFIIPRVGEESEWASYSVPSGKITEKVHSKATSKINIHGIEGVEIRTEFEDYGDDNPDISPHIYYAQLTDTHCRWLGECYVKNGVKHLLTFLDGDDFVSEWGYGENNCGYETHLSPVGKINCIGNSISITDIKNTVDITGHFKLEIGGKEFDTVRIMEWCDNGVLSEQYVDKHGKTVLWRRFNNDNWALSRYKKKWSEQLPENERLTVNGKTYVHWYDCITDYVL